MKTFFFLSAFFISFQCFGWGSKGQEITATVAEGYLSASAKEKVMRITGNKSLASLATWADQVRGSNEWRRSRTWHYINVETMDGFIEKSVVNEPKDIVAAIDYCVENLRSELEDEKKNIWLKFIVHLVGDLHQPMHSGSSQDRGGNLIKVYYGKVLNLHSVWDSAFIEKKRLSVEDYARLLSSQGRGASELKRRYSSERVIEENLKLREFLYSFEEDKIDQNYEIKAFEITDDRLWVGGLRLASVLNAIFE